MSAAPESEAELALEGAIDAACARIAPAWPLERAIAVNPLWGYVELPIEAAAARAAALGAGDLLLPRSRYREALGRGELSTQDLSDALAESGAPTVPLAALRAALDGERAPAGPAPLLTEALDATDRRRGLSWSALVVHQLGQVCAAWFDRGQASWQPARSESLFASWLDALARDPGPRWSMGLPALAPWLKSIPREPRAAITRLLDAMEVQAPAREAYLTALLWSVSGWAAHCAFRRWEARQQGGDDGALLELLAMRLTWDWVLLQQDGGGRATASWRRALGRAQQPAQPAHELDWLLQRALELAHQRPLRRALAEAPTATLPAPRVQAVFCIDVRSEPLRRALEAQDPEIQTLGFAGFFGLPIAYRPLGTGVDRPQLPGLLAPKLRAVESDPAAPTPREEAVARARRRRLERARAWGALMRAPISTFNAVEACGLGFAWALLVEAISGGREEADAEGLARTEQHQLRPRLESTVPLEGRIELAAGILRAMSLTHGFAPLVLLVGHQSQTHNNPLAAGLDCGACGGQSGAVNARVLAGLLNEEEVRKGLALRGIALTDSTRFVAGLHETTTDQLSLFDLDALPDSHAAAAAALLPRLREAGARACAERARRFGAEGSDAQLLRAARRRSRDGAELRPEWGLANNASLIVAPRARTRGLDLQGRAFLHEYRWEEDRGFQVLEQIMTAPMLVAHWINLQYFASTVDNRRFGAGDKLLHNVVAGGLGLFEGNGGDLRVGLPLQSLHDGQRWVHAPLRLSVFIDAPREAIRAVRAKHALVERLIANRWLWLFHIDGERL